MENQQTKSLKNILALASDKNNVMLEPEGFIGLLFDIIEEAKKELKKFTEEMKEEYINSPYHDCPFCKTNDLTTRAQLKPYIMLVTCQHCGERWVEVLGPTDVMSYEEYKGK